MPTAFLCDHILWLMYRAFFFAKIFAFLFRLRNVIVFNFQ